MQRLCISFFHNTYEGALICGETYVYVVKGRLYITGAYNLDFVCPKLHQFGKGYFIPS